MREDTDFPKTTQLVNGQVVPALVWLLHLCFISLCHISQFYINCYIPLPAAWQRTGNQHYAWFQFYGTYPFSLTDVYISIQCAQVNLIAEGYRGKTPRGQKELFYSVSSSPGPEYLCYPNYQKSQIWWRRQGISWRHPHYRQNWSIIDWGVWCTMRTQLQCSLECFLTPHPVLHLNLYKVNESQKQCSGLDLVFQTNDL